MGVIQTRSFEGNEKGKETLPTNQGMKKTEESLPTSIREKETRWLKRNGSFHHNGASTLCLPVGSCGGPLLLCKHQTLFRAARPKTLKQGSSCLDAAQPKCRIFCCPAGYAQKSASPEELHLYQVLSAAGAERAKGWGSNLRLKSRLSLKDSLSKGYFDAPGTDDL
eukprot:scaffold147384_cov20-Tisochrysis_lutea.AAC.1